MSKELIVSIYDGGYYWSVSINGKIYHRVYDSLDGKNPKIVKTIITDFDNNRIKDFVEKYIKTFDRIIICEDGDIEIYE